MLLNDFYTIHDVQPAGDALTCQVVFNVHHGIFKGHFPGQPIVPGVCRMQMVKEILERELDRALRLAKAPNIKFLQLITPVITPLISISWKEIQDGYTVDAVFKTENPLFKFSGTFLAH